MQVALPCILRAELLAEHSALACLFPILHQAMAGSEDEGEDGGFGGEEEDSEAFATENDDSMPGFSAIHIEDDSLVCVFFSPGCLVVWSLFVLG